MNALQHGWSIDEIAPEARRAAERAAEAAGMPLEIWLNQLIKYVSAMELSGNAPTRGRAIDETIKRAAAQQEKTGTAAGPAPLLQSSNPPSPMMLDTGEPELPTTLPAEALAPNRFAEELPGEREIDQSISEWRKSGKLLPLLVRPDSRHQGHYEIVAGIERWHAANRLQMKRIPVTVEQLTDEEVLRATLIQKLTRTNLAPLEEAAIYRRLMEETGLSVAALSDVIGRSPTHVATAMQLLDLPPPVREMIDSGELTVLHARTLLSAADPELAAREVTARKLDIYQTEQLVRASHGAINPALANPPRDGNGEAKPEIKTDEPAEMVLTASVEPQTAPEAATPSFAPLQQSRPAAPAPMHTAGDVDEAPQRLPMIDNGGGATTDADLLDAPSTASFDAPSPASFDAPGRAEALEQGQLEQVASESMAPDDKIATSDRVNASERVDAVEQVEAKGTTSADGTTGEDIRGETDGKAVPEAVPTTAPTDEPLVLAPVGQGSGQDAALALGEPKAAPDREPNNPVDVLELGKPEVQAAPIAEVEANDGAPEEWSDDSVMVAEKPDHTAGIISVPPSAGNSMPETGASQTDADTDDTGERSVAAAAGDGAAEVSLATNPSALPPLNENPNIGDPDTGDPNPEVQTTKDEIEVDVIAGAPPPIPAVSDNVAEGDADNAQDGGQPGGDGDDGSRMVEAHLSTLLGLKVSIAERNQDDGVLSIHYNSQNELTDLVSRLNRMPKGRRAE